MRKRPSTFFGPRGIIHLVLLLAVLVTPLSIIIPKWAYYTTPYYNDATFKVYEHAFNVSQYRVKNPGIIPDETLFSYVSGAYLRGMDPILANSEHTPLGKYFIAASIYVLHNDRFPTLVFAALSGISIWLVGRLVLGSGTLALLPLLLVTLDRLFMNQLVTAPLLDIIQLPFIYLTIAAFLYERKTNRFILTAICIGLVMATKTVVPGVLLIFCIGTFLLLKKEYKTLLRFVCWLPVAAVLFILTYLRTFMSGYTFWDFLKFQKWIFFYQKSKLIYPFSSLRLLMLNQWQSWWGDFSLLRADDWNYLWPISTAASFVGGIWMLIRKRWKLIENGPVVLLLLWVAVYQAFLCLGVVSSRFFIPILPAQYILLVYMVLRLIRNKSVLRSMVIFTVFFVSFLMIPQFVRAEHVLPYPSYMPGNKLYTVSRIVDRIKIYWYWGNISQFRYHLGLADKYLVEAKTLLEYRQYLLGSEALGRSDKEFLAVSEFLSSAKRDGKEVGVLQQTLLDASMVHTTVLTKLLAETPTSFTWTPEKTSASVLELHAMLTHALSVRQSVATEAASL